MKPLKNHINAVKKTIKMWEWLRDNPDKDKEGYFEKMNLKGRSTFFECYLCYHWHWEKVENGCNYGFSNGCPLDNKKGLSCAEDSPFSEWEYHNYTKENAQIIVDLCKDWLKKYNIEEK